MRHDYIHSKRPTALQFWWKRHNYTIKMFTFIAIMAIIGSIN